MRISKFDHENPGQKGGLSGETTGETKGRGVRQCKAHSTPGGPMNTRLPSGVI